MRSLVLSSLLALSAFTPAVPANAAPRMHSAQVMVRQDTGSHSGYYAVRMNGKMYEMMPMDAYQHLLQNSKANGAGG